jgi:regulator of PEP synthase PpsR (kinase-PPPase family)
MSNTSKAPKSSRDSLKAVVLSDGTGETAKGLTRAALRQFPDHDVLFSVHKRVTSEAEIETIFHEAALHHDLIIYSLVSKHLRNFVQTKSKEENVVAIDILGPLLEAMRGAFSEEPLSTPGTLHQVNPDYFRKIEAIEYSLKHDHGQNPDSLMQADLVLLGGTQSGKTPLALHLAMEGFKVANVTLTPESGLLPFVQQIEHNKIFALIIDPRKLQMLSPLSEETLQKLEIQQKWWRETLKNNRRWPTINMTDKTLEETAADIQRVLVMRKSNISKQGKRFT